MKISNMKKVIYSIFLFLFLSSTVSAQIWSENFDNGLPSSFSTIDNDGLPAHASASSYDGIAWLPFAKYMQNNSKYDPPGQADDWLITGELVLPQIDLPNKLIFTWEATSVAWSVQNTYEVWISNTGNSLDDFLNTGNLLTTVVDENAGSFTKRSTDLSNYLGQTVWIALRDVSDDKWILTVDNFAIEEYVAHDLEITDLNFFSFYENDTEVMLKGDILNLGHEQVNSITVNYAIGNEVFTRTLSGYTVDQFRINMFTHPMDFTGSDETKLIEVWISEVNGSPNANLDRLERNVIFYDPSLSTERDGLIETFTSSTCGPCKAANEHLTELLNDFGANAPMSIKYQQDFPGRGDPYATDETIARKNHHKVIGIPRSVINGRLLSSSTSFVEEVDLTAANAQTALVNMNGVYTLDPSNQFVSMEVTVQPIIDMIPNTRLFFAVVEKEAVNNIKTNGETFFDNVVKKLVPDENGYDLSNLTSGQVETISFDYTFPGDYRLPENAVDSNRIDLAIEHSVENFEELYVVAWVDHKYDRWILGATSLQSISSVENISMAAEIKLLNSADGFALDSESNVFDDLIIMDAAGRLISKRPFQVGAFISTENWETGIYFLHLIGPKERQTLKYFAK